MILQASCPSVASRAVLYDQHGSPGDSEGSCDAAARSRHTCCRLGAACFKARVETTFTKNDDKRNGGERGERGQPLGPAVTVTRGGAGAWRPQVGGGWWVGRCHLWLFRGPVVSGKQLRTTGLPKPLGAVDSGLGKVRGWRGPRHRDLGGRGPGRCPVLSSPGTRLTQARCLLSARHLACLPQSPAGHTATRSRLLRLAVGPSPVPSVCGPAALGPGRGDH